LFAHKGFIYESIYNFQTLEKKIYFVENSVFRSMQIINKIMIINHLFNSNRKPHTKRGQSCRLPSFFFYCSDRLNPKEKLPSLPISIRDPRTDLTSALATGIC